MTTDLISEVGTSASPPPCGQARHGLPGRHLGLLLVAVSAVVARLPFVARPLSPDEAGFLLVAAQWAPGHSLYGNYWVDRPPLLIGFFGLADGLGGAVPLRLLGITLVVTGVLLSARLAALVSDRAGATSAATARARLLAAATAAIFLSTPLFDSAEVNGELVAVPLVLLGLILLLEAAATPSATHRHWWLLAAGAAGAAAALVKQNEVDVLVAVVVAAVTVLPRARDSVVRNLSAAAAGALALGALVLGWAATRGSEPVGLWDALVTFRLDAGEVISTSASAATTARFHLVLLALVVSGVVLVPLQLLRVFRSTGGGPLASLRWPLVAVLAWELFSVVAGGSYWLHYLLVLVPGVVLAVSLLAHGSSRSVAWLRRGLAYSAVVSVVGVGYLVAQPAQVSPLQPVETWLSSHARPGDTAVVAFGRPDILQATGLTSPYSELWSLPARVRDPRLAELSRVLAGPDRPTWVVTMNGSTTNSLATWGIDPRAGQAQLDAHYRVVADVDGRVVYLDRSRPLEAR